MADERPVLQIAQGSYIAQAAPGGTAMVVHYEFAPATPIDEEQLAQAAATLEALPSNDVASVGPLPVGPLPVGSRMGFGANALFTGRGEELRVIGGILKGSRDGRSPCVAVTGIPGAGKTQVASEFVHHYGRFFAGGVYWLSFADPSGIAGEIATCGTAGLMNLRPDFETLPLEERARLVMSAWQNELPRLLVFDNCEDEALLAQWRPPTGGSRILATSRSEHWDPALGVTVLPLDLLPRTDSIALLRRYRDDLASDDPALDEIAGELGDLPLALHLAGSYLWRYRQAMAPSDYLGQLRRAELRHRSLRTVDGFSPTGHGQDVALTFAVSYERLDRSIKTDATATFVMAEIAHLAPGELIPIELLQSGALGPNVAEDEVFEARLELEDALERLVELGLVQRTPAAGVRLHRLLAAFVHESADVPGAREQIADRVIAIFHSLQVAGNVIRAEPLEVHLRALTDVAVTRSPEYLTRELCNTLGGHLRESGDYAESVHYLQLELVCARALLGREDPLLARDLNDLGLSLLRNGNLEEARAYLEAALPRWEQLGDMPNFAATIDNLGQLHSAIGDDVAAELHFRRALELREQHLDPLDSRIAVTLTNLGGVLMQRGDPGGALAYFRRSLAIREQTLGEQHQATGISLGNEAVALHATGDLSGALRSAERAVETYTASLGDKSPQTLAAVARVAIFNAERSDLALDELPPRIAEGRLLALKSPSPSTATLLNNLGIKLWELGEFALAIETYRDALSIEETVVGSHHPDLITILNNIGMVKQWLEDSDGARDAYERAVEIVAAAGSVSNVLSARVSNNYGVFLLSIGDVRAAHTWLESAKAERARLLGAEHPDTAVTLSNVGMLLLAEENLDNARKLVESAAAIARRNPGDGRALPRCLHQQGIVLRAVGLPEFARPSLEEALRLRAAALPTLHPDTALTLAELGELEVLARRYEPARVHLVHAMAICDARLMVGPEGKPLEHSLTARVREALACVPSEDTEGGVLEPIANRTADRP